MIPVSVNYVPVVLRSMSEICRAFGVGCEQVRKWVAADAPIVVDRDEKGEITRYRAELNRLYLWQEARSKESPGSAGESGDCLPGGLCLPTGAILAGSDGDQPGTGKPKLCGHAVDTLDDDGFE